MTRFALRFFAFVFLAVLPVACGGDDGTGPGAVVEISMTAQNTYVPANVTVRVGQRVRWINDAAIFHTITPRNAAQPGVFSRATRSTTGTALEHTFGTAGTYDYFCEPHESVGMTGRVTVTN